MWALAFENLTVLDTDGTDAPVFLVGYWGVFETAGISGSRSGSTAAGVLTEVGAVDSERRWQLLFQMHTAMAGAGQLS